MGKSCKTKKEKVPKLTEAQYAEYISSLKEMPDPIKTAEMPSVGDGQTEPEKG